MDEVKMTLNIILRVIGILWLCMFWFNHVSLTENSSNFNIMVTSGLTYLVIKSCIGDK